MTRHGYCPFRVQTESYEAGCSLQYGTSTNCYSQGVRPLIFHEEQFFCPKMMIKIDLETYNMVETLIKPLLKMQDEDEISMNLRPVILGLSHPKINAETILGNDLVVMARKVAKSLEEIVFNM